MEEPGRLIGLALLGPPEPATEPVAGAALVTGTGATADLCDVAVEVAT